MFNLILFTESKSNVETRGIKAFKDIMAKMKPSIEADAVEVQSSAVKSAAAKPTTTPSSTKRKSTTPKTKRRKSSPPKSSAIKHTPAKSSSSSQTGSSSESDDTNSSPVSKRRKQIEKGILAEAGSPEGCQCEQLKIELDRSNKKLAALQEKNLQDG